MTKVGRAVRIALLILIGFLTFTLNPVASASTPPLEVGPSALVTIASGHANALGAQPAVLRVPARPVLKATPRSHGDSHQISDFGVAAEAGAGAENAANGLRLGQQLARESADSAFTSSGGLQQEVIDGSTRIIPGSNINYPGVIKQLTSDGSDIADWGKYTSRTFQSPSGPFQVHYYYNPSTGVVDYGYDYKVVFNGAR